MQFVLLLLVSLRVAQGRSGPAPPKMRRVGPMRDKGNFQGVGGFKDLVQRYNLFLLLEGSSFAESQLIHLTFRIQLYIVCLHILLLIITHAKKNKE